jgi:hypothetical protein
MKRMQRAAALLTCSLALTAGSCPPKRVVTALPIPAERMVCAPADATRPTVPAEYTLNWNPALSAPNVKEAVARALIEHGRYVASVRAREGVVAGYVVSLEGKLFVCSNNMAWIRDFQAGTTQ